jgi:transcriptional regulator of arginine metabolism
MILDLISTYEIETQDELCERLARSGYNVTQATVSRDIRELKLTKMVGAGGRQVYTRYHQNGLKEDEGGRHLRILREAVKTVQPACNILVIRTNAGMASAVATAIDAMELPGMAGCIAGDDTIMCAMQSEEMAKQAVEVINQKL